MNVITYFSKMISPDKPKATSDELTLEYYEIWISEGIRSAIHGNFSKITEIYVPELKIAINLAISPINVFLVTYDRYTNKGNSMSGKPIKLLKTVIISRKSPAAKNLLWLEDCLKNKKEKEAPLRQLFDTEESENNKENE
jgi:hypothetical protein